MDWSKFTLTDGKHILAAPCLEVVAFSYAHPTLIGFGFTHFLQTFIDQFSDQLTFYCTGDMKRFRSIDRKSLDAPFYWFSDEKILATNMLGFVTHSGEIQQNICPPALKLTLCGFDDSPRFIFRIALPIELGNNPDAVLKFALDALKDFPLENGYCGYSFIWNQADKSLEKQVCDWSAPLLLRHPGFGFGNAVKISNAADRGVVVVSWLTFLGSRITAYLGGKDALESKCPPEISVYPLGKEGVLLRAGIAPELGDVNRQELLPAYRAVGRLVAPCRTTDEAFDDVQVLGMSEEVAYDWLRRFFV